MDEESSTNLIRKLHVVKYWGKVFNCPKCDSLLVDVVAPYISNDGEEKHCNLKRCKNCCINYVNENLYDQISNEDSNPNIVLDSFDSECRGFYKGGLLSVVLYETKLKSCRVCRGPLTSYRKQYFDEKARKRYCFIKMCPHCKIDYLHANTYAIIKKHGCAGFIVDSLDDKRVNVKTNSLSSSGSASKPNSGNPNPSTTPSKPLIFPPKTPNNIVKTLDGVFVYKSINNTCKRKHPEMVKQIQLTLKSVKNNNIHTVYGFHCNKCNKNFITVEAILPYTSKAYIPQFKCNLSDEYTGNIRQTSMLAIYGYNVREGELSVKQRHAIIDFVIEYKIMSAMDVINLLQFLIKLNSPMPSKEDACEKWHDDIRYVQTIR